jgi:hypothetical protein
VRSTASVGGALHCIAVHTATLTPFEGGSRLKLIFSAQMDTKVYYLDYEDVP